MLSIFGQCSVKCEERPELDKGKNFYIWFGILFEIFISKRFILTELGDSESLSEATEEEGLVFQNVTDDEKLLASQSVTTLASEPESSPSDQARGVESRSQQEFTLDNR